MWTCSRHSLQSGCVTEVYAAKMLDFFKYGRISRVLDLCTPMYVELCAKDQAVRYVVGSRDGEYYTI